VPAGSTRPEGPEGTTPLLEAAHTARAGTAVPTLESESMTVHVRHSIHR
jgi:hypothetical protein